MKCDQTDEIFLVITKNDITYTKTSTEAAFAAGIPKWQCLKERQAIQALEAGDELSLNSHTSVIRLTGRDYDFEPKE